MPNSFVKLGDGSYYYNYDIKVEEPKTEEDVQGYSCTTVHLFGEPDYKDCVKAIIRTYISQDEEFDLINSYNQNKIEGIDAQSDDIDKYKEYLELLKDIKVKVKKDFNL